MLKLFGEKKATPAESLKKILSYLLEEGQFLLSFQVEETGPLVFHVDIFGEDEGLLKNNRGRLLLAFQTYLLRVLQNNFPEDKIKVHVDSNGFWEEQEQKLMDLTQQFINKSLETNQPVMFKKPLSPSQRRLVHQRVSGNTGVRSESIGDGIYKKMKLIPDTYRGEDK